MSNTISIRLGKGYLRHNNRDFYSKNVDKNKIKDNVIIYQKDLEKTYQELFGEAVEKHNLKQTREDRKIKNYLEKIKNSKNGEKPFYEIIIQIGDKNNFGIGSENAKISNEILEETARVFEVEYPNFKMLNAVIHNDEKTPHLHIDFIPISTKNKRGLETKNSMRSALKQMGYYSKTEEKKPDFLTPIRAVVERKCKEKNIEIKTIGTDRDYLPISQYKAMKDLERERYKLLKTTKDVAKFGKRKKAIKHLNEEKANLEISLENSEKIIEKQNQKFDFYSENIAKIDNVLNLENTVAEKTAIIEKMDLENQELKHINDLKQNSIEYYEKQTIETSQKVENLEKNITALKEKNKALEVENKSLKNKLHNARIYLTELSQNVGIIFKQFNDTITQDNKLARCFKTIRNFIYNRLPNGYDDKSLENHVTPEFRKEFEKTEEKKKVKSLGLSL